MPDDKTIKGYMYSFSGSSETPLTIDSNSSKVEEDAERGADRLTRAFKELQSSLVKLGSKVKIELPENIYRKLLKDYEGKEEAKLGINFTGAKSNSAKTDKDNIIDVDVTKTNVQIFVNALHAARFSVSQMTTRLNSKDQPITEEEIVSGIQKAMKKMIDGPLPPK